MFVSTNSGLGRVTGDSGFVKRRGEAVLINLRAQIERRKQLVAAEKKLAEEKTLLEQKQAAVNQAINDINQSGATATASLLGNLPMIAMAAGLAFIFLRK